MAIYRRPAPLGPQHDTTGFTNRHRDLVDWLQQRALANEASRASRTYVVCEAKRVVGYYALAAGALELAAAPGRIRRNMPAPIPAIVLGRLAVDEAHQGKGIGRGLLRDAVLRSLGAAGAIGARVLLCHALDEAARGFNLANGFLASPVGERVVMLDLRKVVYRD